MNVTDMLRAGAREAHLLGWSRRQWLERVQKSYMDMRQREHTSDMPSRQPDTIEERTLAADRAWLEVTAP